MCMNKKLHAYYDGWDTVIAWSKEEASLVWKEVVGDVPSYFDYPWVRQPDDRILAIGYEEINRIPENIVDGMTIIFHEWDSFDYGGLPWEVSAPLSVWIKSMGRSWLATESCQSAGYGRKGRLDG